jgi:hypothetical protein
LVVAAQQFGSAVFESYRWTVKGKQPKISTGTTEIFFVFPFSHANLLMSDFSIYFRMELFSFVNPPTA